MTDERSQLLQMDFEAWALIHLEHLAHDLVLDTTWGGTYANKEVEAAWKAWSWQAARAAPEQEQESVADLVAALNAAAIDYAQCWKQGEPDEAAFRDLGYQRGKLFGEAADALAARAAPAHDDEPSVMGGGVMPIEAPAQPVSHTVATAPKRIYLNVFERFEDDLGFPDDHEGVTWCEDKIGDNDIEYVRADLAEAAPAQPALSPESMDKLTSATKELIKASERLPPT
jgi:hypothetical protein